MANSSRHWSALSVICSVPSGSALAMRSESSSEPSESTRKLVAGLNQPIRVVGFFPEVSPVRYEVESYLRKLAAGTKNLKVEVHDRYLSPKLAKDEPNCAFVFEPTTCATYARCTTCTRRATCALPGLELRADHELWSH